MPERQPQYEISESSFGAYLQDLFVQYTDFIERSRHIRFEQLRLCDVKGATSTEAIIDAIPGSVLLPSLDIVTTVDASRQRERFHFGRSHGYTYEVLLGQAAVEAERKQISRPATAHDLLKAFDLLETLAPIRPPEITDTRQRRINLLSFLGNITGSRR